MERDHLDYLGYLGYFGYLGYLGYCGDGRRGGAHHEAAWAT